MLAGLGLLVVAVVLPNPSLALFLLGGVVTGGGAGLLFKGAVATVAALAPPERRAEALAGIFLTGYVGLAVPVIGLGLLTRSTSPQTALVVFAAVLAVGALVAARTIRTP